MIYLELFWTFFTIGAFTFGGGYAMLPLIQQTVLEQGWLNQQQVIDFVAVSESTPGPLAVNMSTYVGVRVAGIPGAFTATLGVVLPSFLLILVISGCYQKFQSNRLVRGALYGLKPTVVALIITATLSITGTVFHITNPMLLQNGIGLIILLICAGLCFKKKHPILIILISALLGIIFGNFIPT